MITALETANYFLFLDEENDGDGISNLKLQKLVYYAQGFYSAIFKAALFDDEIEAWAHGPVIASLYHQFKQYGKNPIPFERGVNPGSVSEDEKGLIEEVYEVMGQYSAWKLRNMTHEESPWINHESSAGVIPKNEIEEYFRTRVN